MNDNFTTYKKMKKLRDNLVFLDSDIDVMMFRDADEKIYKTAHANFEKDYKKLQLRVDELKKAKIL